MSLCILLQLAVVVLQLSDAVFSAESAVCVSCRLCLPVGPQQAGPEVGPVHGVTAVLRQRARLCAVQPAGAVSLHHQLPHVAGTQEQGTQGGWSQLTDQGLGFRV